MVAVIAQVPDAAVMVMAPVEASTEHAVDDPALKLYAPDPLPPAAVAVRPV